MSWNSFFFWECGQECASSYEKAVFEVIQYIISPDRDDDLVVQQHSKVDIFNFKIVFIICVSFAVTAENIAVCFKFY